MIHFLWQCVVAFVATWAFTVLFHVPREQYFWCGLTGMAGWACYLAVLMVTPSEPIASFFAASVLAVMSRIFSTWRRCPSTPFLICGIFPLVPGAGIYYAAYYFIFGDSAMAAKSASNTFKIAVGIALGIVLVLSLPGKLFGWFAPTKRQLKHRGDRP